MEQTLQGFDVTISDGATKYEVWPGTNNVRGYEYGSWYAYKSGEKEPIPVKRGGRICEFRTKQAAIDACVEHRKDEKLRDAIDVMFEDAEVTYWEDEDA